MSKCKDKKIYITTPIYYVNDVPHIGHAYTTIIADTIARYSRLVGYDTFFLTGTDEHGQKIEQSAKKKGKSVQEYADEISPKFKNLWDEFDISYDKFIRTTYDYHKKGVKAAFLKMYKKGDIYKGKYEGHYCVSCESFFNERDLLDGGACPDCGKETSIVEEESYFFKLSAYQDRLLEFYKNNPDFILPRSRAKEVINFVEGGLEDLSISRTSFDWGVKLPDELNDPKHVMYVWLDALLNYITALGYENDEKDLMQYWPAKVHIVGKDILRFHAIYWPAFLMSLELPLPSHIAAHGWWTRDGQKMSKSKGNVINPKEVVDTFGLDEFRYFLLREVPFGQDGDFGYKSIISRINNELGNDLGNLLNRIIGMSGKYFDYKLDSSEVKEYCRNLLDEVDIIIDRLPEYLYQMQLNRYLEDIWKILNLANKAIGDFEPWNLMKNNKEKKAMALVAFIANIMSKVMLLLYPVMPHKMDEVSKSLGVAINTDNYIKLIENKELVEEFEIKKVNALFPKIDEKEFFKNLSEKESKKEVKKSQTNLISIEEFFKTEIKVGTIIEAQEIKKSKKLLLLKVDLGEDSPRQIVAGIKEYYSANDLIGKQVCVVANLKPAKIMGYESQGMILAAKDSNGLNLITPESKKENGTKIS